MIKYLFILLLSAFSLFSCTALQAVRFDQAVNDAAVVEKKDICNDLIAIRPDNQRLVWNRDRTRVLVVIWKSLDSFDQYYKHQTRTAMSTAYVTWVTAAPQVKQFAQAFLAGHPGATDAQVTLRLKQYLGLKPQWQYDVFAELWVDPGDLFRPCVDPETNDKACNLQFSKQDPQVKGIPCYPCFYKNLYFEDFRTRPGIPWTGLGYTYDWGNPVSPVGASEFILVPGAAYEIERVIPTMEYVRD